MTVCFRSKSDIQSKINIKPKAKSCLAFFIETKRKLKNEKQLVRTQSRVGMKCDY